MKNKELALRKLEQVNSAMSNLKTSVYRGYSDVEDRFERVQNLLEELDTLISIEEETFLNRNYKGL